MQRYYATVVSLLEMMVPGIRLFVQVTRGRDPQSDVHARLLTAQRRLCDTRTKRGGHARRGHQLFPGLHKTLGPPSGVNQRNLTDIRQHYTCTLSIAFEKIFSRLTGLL